MTFIDERLPEDVEKGARGGPTWSTFIVTARNGQEFRNAGRAQPIHAFDISYGVSEISELLDVRALFMNTKGRLFSFRFKDWSDYVAEEELIEEGDGVKLIFQLVKNYTFGNVSFKRIITKPFDDGNLEVFVDGVPTPVVVDFLTGLITFAVAPAVVDITWSGEFDVPVRFEVDEFIFSLMWEQVGEIPGLVVREVNE